MDGTLCRSRLEAAMYNALKQWRVPFLFEKKIELIPGFRSGGKAVRPISWTPDFTLGPDDFLDTKGYATEIFRLKLKLLKYSRWREGGNVNVYLVEKKAQIPAFVAAWKSGNASALKTFLH